MMKATDAILENLLDAVLVVNQGGNIIYANRAAQELFCLSAEQLAGQPFGFPIVPQEVQEIDVWKGDQRLTVQMLASHILWEGKTASLLSLRDVTAQKLVQQELTRQKLLLEKTNEENANYASLASHDLKEPIRKILIFSDRLLTSRNIPENERVQLQRIHASAKRMHALIGGIAELSRVAYVKHDFTPVNLREPVEDVWTDLELQVEEKGATIDVSDLPTIDAIPGEMYQLFLNLIANALKYSKADVHPHIRIREKEDEDDYVCIECSDNGIGFANELAAKLFQPFQRLHAAEYDGMGIGLTLCQKIVAVHNGQITAEGESGRGATFRIRLPRRQFTEANARLQ